jgi:hypothetical protein
LINVINDKGGGPHEYFGLQEALVIHNDELIIADRKKPKRLFYNLDGVFIRSEKSLPSLSFETINDKFVLHIGDHQTWNESITPQIVISVGDSAIRRALPFHNTQKDNFAGKFHLNYKNDLLFLPVLSDTIYQILNDSSYTTKYLFKNKKSIWARADENLTFEQINHLVGEGRYSIFNGDFYETEDNIYFKLTEKSAFDQYLSFQWYWYDKQRQQVFHSVYSDGALPSIEYIREKAKEKYDIEDDIVDNILAEPIAIWNNYYIGVLEPQYIEALRKYYKKNDTILDKKNVDFQKNIKSNDSAPNQVLVFYKMNFSKVK